MDNQLLNQYKVWSGMDANRRPDFVDFIRKNNPWLFAHHPNNACFREHVWEFNGFYLCKGCVVTYLGFLTGLVIQLATGWISVFSEETIGLIFTFLLMPAIVTASFKFPRPIKHISRFLLGILIISSLFLLFITDRWDVRLIVITTYILVKTIFEKKREKQNQQKLERCAQP